VVHKEEGEIGIEFHLLKNQGQWQVVDVDLDEVSMRNNLRSQFYKIINKNDYQDLVRRMEEKLKESKS
jgi:ABC-type transporter MlaC component